MSKMVSGYPGFARAPFFIQNSTVFPIPSVRFDSLELSSSSMFDFPPNSGKRFARVDAAESEFGPPLMRMYSLFSGNM